MLWSSAERSGDAAEQIHWVDAEPSEQVRVHVGVHDLGQLTLRAIGHVVLSSTAKFVHDLLSVNLHVGILSSLLGCPTHTARLWGTSEGIRRG